MKTQIANPGLIKMLMIVLIILPELAGCGGSDGVSPSNNFIHQQIYLSQTSSLKGLLYLPINYENSTNSWPLLIYLHGMGLRGDNLNMLVQPSNNDIPSIIEQGKEFPFIVISPQCPSTNTWSDSAMINNLHHLITELSNNYRINPKQIYLTGFSMGGSGTWALAINHPELFAAIAPVGGSSYPDENAVANIKNIPTWIFHGESDEVVPFSNAQRMLDLLQICNGNVRLTKWPNVNHLQSCNLTYRNQDLYDWLLQQSQ